jgi:hypothetical protein
MVEPVDEAAAIVDREHRRRLRPAGFSCVTGQVVGGQSGAAPQRGNRSGPDPVVESTGERPGVKHHPCDESVPEAIPSKPQAPGVRPGSPSFADLISIAITLQSRR